MKKLLLFPLVTMLVFMISGACTKTTDPVWVVYYEQNCIPPWISEKNDNKSRKNLESMLKGDGIIPLKIKIKGERLPECSDCYCLTGKSYHVQIDKSQLNYIYYYNFVSE